MLNARVRSVTLPLTYSLTAFAAAVSVVGAAAIATVGARAARADAPKTRDAFFSPTRMYYLRLRDWNPQWTNNGDFVTTRHYDGAKLEIFATDPHNQNPCPENDATADNFVYLSNNFQARLSGNRTFNMPKSSYKLKAKKENGKANTLFGMNTFNLKAMWNDASQMREAIAWEIFKKAGVKAPGHAYVKFCILAKNTMPKYIGLYSMIEAVDEAFLKSRFSEQSKGNLYKGYWSPNDVNQANFKYRQDASGDDSGKNYFKLSTAQIDAQMVQKLADCKGAEGAKRKQCQAELDRLQSERENIIDKRTYVLKTNTDFEKLGVQTYDDIATLARVLNSGDPQSDAFRQKLDQVLDTKQFLTWAAVNLLLGAWDNYWATPANFYIYNGGRPGSGAQNFMSQPYFSWIPWDYDNSFGLTYWSTRWEYADLLDWPSSTKTYGNGHPSFLPLITRMLENPAYREFYLTKIEFMLDHFFNEKWIQDRVQTLWAHIWTAVQLESGPIANSNWDAQPYTKRQFTYREVEGHASQQLEIHGKGNSLFSLSILNYVKTRNWSAREQLKKLGR